MAALGTGKALVSSSFSLTSYRALVRWFVGSFVRWCVGSLVRWFVVGSSFVRAGTAQAYFAMQKVAGGVFVPTESPHIAAMWEQPGSGVPEPCKKVPQARHASR